MPFDAVLLISFGGPQGPDDIRPFLANVLRGRRIPPERIEEVAHHYELFGGVSPITALTMQQAAGLRSRLETSAHELPVYVGMRNWTPFLADTLAEMSRDGIRHALGFILAAQKSYSSCGQYKQNVHDAQLGLRDAGLAHVDVTYVPNWHDHPRFIDANAQHVREAMATLPADLAPRARLVFTAHSIPVPSAEACQYREQLQASARLVAEQLGHADWVLVYQSRSGRPDDPWLGPDICDYLREARAGGLEAAVLCPIGFVCDHVEVLYDLDYEAAAVCREVGLEMRRAETVNDDPRFVDMMDDVVEQMMDRYATGRPLQIVSTTGFERREGPPPHARPPR